MYGDIDVIINGREAGGVTYELAAGETTLTDTLMYTGDKSFTNGKPGTTSATLTNPPTGAPIPGHPLPSRWTRPARTRPA